MFLAGQTPENEPESPSGGHPVLDTVMALAVGVDVSGIAEDECMAFVSQLAQVRAVFDAVETQVLCRMERSQTTQIETGHTTAPHQRSPPALPPETQNSAHEVCNAN